MPNWEPVNEFEDEEEANLDREVRGHNEPEPRATESVVRTCPECFARFEISKTSTRNALFGYHSSNSIVRAGPKKTIGQRKVFPLPEANDQDVQLLGLLLSIGLEGGSPLSEPHIDLVLRAQSNANQE